MNSILEVLSSTSMTWIIGWTLIHFVWQAALIGLIVWAVLQGNRLRSSQARYLTLCGGLALMTISPIVTVALLFSVGSSDPSMATNDPFLTRPTVSSEKDQTDLDESPSAPQVDLADKTTRSADLESRLPTESFVIASRRKIVAGIDFVSTSARPLLPLFVLAWVVSVFLLAIRHLFGFKRVRQWRGTAVKIGGGELPGLFSHLKKTMSVGEAVELLQSTQVVVPMVTGWLKPVVLVPASLISNLSTEEIESLLAHELAHIRRHDYLVNLIQIAAETIFFYHPVVWWISGQIRIERENCCDDSAISVCGDRLVFATALSRIEEIRISHERFVVAAGGGSLVNRIQRLTTGEPEAASRWPAGIMTLVALAIAVGSLTVSGALATHSPAASISNSNTNRTDGPNSVQDTYQSRKNEIKKRDSKTGLEKRVYEGIRLTSNRVAPAKTMRIEMMYSNVMNYTFIPERIAKQLTAMKLGEIDFGETAPPARKSFQTGVLPMPRPAPARTPEKHLIDQTITVDQLTQPAGDIQIVPYQHDAIWVPGHLGLYGMNRLKQHKFQVVRIDSMDLGVGLPFGPINALVLSDENSDFGVLGKNAAARVLGKNSERLWWHADGTFQLVAQPQKAQRLVKGNSGAQQSPGDGPPIGRPPILRPEQLKVESSRASKPQFDLNEVKPEIKRFKTRSYSMASRASTGWVLVDGVRIPIDGGVEHDGVIVYVTLMFDVLAVDAKTEEVLWRLRWGKTDPIWQTVSVVELEIEDKKQIAIELFATKNRTRELIFRYVDLTTGDPIELSNQRDSAQPSIPPDDSPSPQTDSGPGDSDAGNARQADHPAKNRHKKPWSVHGRVTDALGNPIEGATVRAHCGVGTLRQSGSALTDTNGDYTFRFGPGFWSADQTMIQAATISVEFAGHFEKNLHRQGDLVAAYQAPKGEIGWGGKTIDDLFLPDKPKEIDFVMVPATQMSGIVVVAETGKRPEGLRISLQGDDMPPSSSVVAHTTTDEKGRFEFPNIPTGFPYQLVVEPAKAEPPWLAWASPPMTFVKGNSTNTHLEYTIEETESDFSFGQLNVILNGKGVNWKTAVKDAASKRLDLTWDGLSTIDNKIVTARSATIEIGQ